VERAHGIDDKLHGKVSSRDLGDDEIADFEDDGDISTMEVSDADNNPTDPPPCRVRTARVDPPLPSHSSTRQPPSKAFDFLEKITKSLDPENQVRRDAERTLMIFQSQQLLLFQSQVRELNMTVQSLRAQLDNAERRWADADRRADRLQRQVDMMTHERLFRSADQVPEYYNNPPPTSPSSPSSPASTPDHNRRYEATFNDGGHCTWFGDTARFNDDDDVIQVDQIPWSPPPHSPAQSVEI
jgi:hypothetical protein